MTRRRRPSETLRSIAGGILVGLGLHILFGNLDRASAQLRDLLGASSGEALGVVPSIVLTTSHAVQAYTSDHRVLLLGLLRAMVAFWPLLPVVAGTTLLRDALTDKVKALPTRAKYFQNEGTACRFGCPSFDV